MSILSFVVGVFVGVVLGIFIMAFFTGSCER